MFVGNEYEFPGVEYKCLLLQQGFCEWYRSMWPAGMDESNSIITWKGSKGKVD